MNASSRLIALEGVCLSLSLFAAIVQSASLHTPQQADRCPPTLFSAGHQEAALCWPPQRQIATSSSSGSQAAAGTVPATTSAPAMVRAAFVLQCPAALSAAQLPLCAAQALAVTGAAASAPGSAGCSTSTSTASSSSSSSQHEPTWLRHILTVWDSMTTLFVCWCVRRAVRCIGTLVAGLLRRKSQHSVLSQRQRKPAGLLAVLLRTAWATVAFVARCAAVLLLGTFVAAWVVGCFEDLTTAHCSHCVLKAAVELLGTAWLSMTREPDPQERGSTTAPVPASTPTNVISPAPAAAAAAAAARSSKQPAGQQQKRRPRQRMQQQRHSNNSSPVASDNPGSPATTLQQPVKQQQQQEELPAIGSSSGAAQTPASTASSVDDDDTTTTASGWRDVTRKGRSRPVQPVGRQQKKPSPVPAVPAAAVVAYASALIDDLERDSSSSSAGARNNRQARKPQPAAAAAAAAPSSSTASSASATASTVIRGWTEGRAVAGSSNSSSLAGGRRLAVLTPGAHHQGAARPAARVGTAPRPSRAAASRAVPGWSAAAEAAAAALAAAALEAAPSAAHIRSSKRSGSEGARRPSADSVGSSPAGAPSRSAIVQARENTGRPAAGSPPSQQRSFSSHPARRPAGLAQAQQPVSASSAPGAAAAGNDYEACSCASPALLAVQPTTTTVSSESSSALLVGGNLTAWPAAAAPAGPAVAGPSACSYEPLQWASSAGDTAAQASAESSSSSVSLLQQQQQQSSAGPVPASDPAANSRTSKSSRSFRPRAAQSPHATADSDGQQLCVICWDAERTHGVLHGDSIHLCLCGACAAAWDCASRGCPMCRQPAEEIMDLCGA